MAKPAPAAADRPDAPPLATAAAPAAAGGGLASWLPLIVTIVAMPALAYVMTMYVLLPKVQATIGLGVPAAAKGAPASHEGDKAKDNTTVTMNKILVNVAGTSGTRYLLATIAVSGDAAGFKEAVELRKAQLLDLASGILSSKTIEDLEREGARNRIRNELRTAFASALGDDFVKDIYFTEFAIQ
jgi:flagellar protein FliL